MRRNIDPVTRVLDSVGTPADLRELGPADLDVLATEIRDLLVQTVARTGGHLGPNLGAVELTIALHRVFDSPTEPILFDVGHQAYVHKILTGRAEQMPTLRQGGGLSGYPSRDESPHDWIENSHASTALSYADGLAKAYEVRGERRPVVAVVGDGALTGGMCWEALNNIAAADRPVIVVVNDNGRSYSPTIGGLAEHLAALRLKPGYERMLGQVKGALGRTPVVGAPIYDALHGMKRGIKDLLQPQGMFEDLGLKYFGPVDGHDVAALETAFKLARGFDGPVIVHSSPARASATRRPRTTSPTRCTSRAASTPTPGWPAPPPARSWTKVFGQELVSLAEQRDDIVAITAAMCEPTGLGEFSRRFPDRFYDVGIAEQHAMTSAAGLATGGLHPVVAVYATFLNRAFDQLLMDVALHRLPVTVVLDRAGITGDDGPSHNGMWDLALLGIVPGPAAGRPARRADPARAAARGSRRRRRPHRPALPEDPAGRRDAGTAPRGRRRRPRRARRVGPGRRAPGRRRRHGLRRARGRGRRAPRRLHDPGRRPALGEPGRPGARRPRTARPAWSSRVEDGVVSGGVGSRVSQTLRDAGCDVADPRDRHTGTVPRTRQRAGRPCVRRADSPGHRAADRRMVGAPVAGVGG